MPDLTVADLAVQRSNGGLTNISIKSQGYPLAIWSDGRLVGDHLGNATLLLKGHHYLRMNQSES